MLREKIVISLTTLLMFRAHVPTLHDDHLIRRGLLHTVCQWRVFRFSSFILWGHTNPCELKLSTGTSRTSDPISTIQGPFPQKIGVTTDDFQADHEYLTNQRRRNLPVGESGQKPSGEPATGLAKHSGNCLLMDGTRESSYSECDDG
jgi:hypothetical protein